MVDGQNPGKSIDDFVYEVALAGSSVKLLHG